MVDLTVLSDDMLDGVYARLLADCATAHDCCDKADMRAAHEALEDVIREYSRRTDEWIAEHTTEGATP